MTILEPRLFPVQQHATTSDDYYTPAWDIADGFADGGMFRFVRASDGQLENVFMPVVFAAFGEDCVEAISRLGRVRR